MSTDSADHNLEYLTVDTIHWATGHERARMPIEQKRAKHRVHQQQFMLRQRQRMEQLHAEMRRLALQLQLLEAANEAASLLREQAAMRQQLQYGGSMMVSNDCKMPFDLHCPGAKASSDASVYEEAWVLETFGKLTETELLHAKSPSDVAAFTWSHDATQAEALSWPTSPSCAATFLELLC